MSLDDILKLIVHTFPECRLEENTGACLVPKKDLPGLAKFLREEPCFFDELNCLTAIDDKDSLCIVYMLYSSKRPGELRLKVKLPSLADLCLETVSTFWKSADWFEREVFDLYGVRFLNHPNLKRILNPEDWKGFPLRKNYEDPRVVMRPKT